MGDEVGTHQKIKKNKKPLDNLQSICYNEDTNKQEVATESQGGSKNFKKNKKGLDKQKPKCYNKDVNKQNKSKERNEELSYG